jgi:hypothetical protein
VQKEKIKNTSSGKFGWWLQRNWVLDFAYVGFVDIQQPYKNLVGGKGKIPPFYFYFYLSFVILKGLVNKWKEGNGGRSF